MKPNLSFTALAELSTRQIAAAEKSKGIRENAIARKKSGTVARIARNELESRTGKKVITSDNFLPPDPKKKQLKKGKKK